MSQKKDLFTKTMLDFTQASVDLAASVQADITMGEELSNETVLALSKWKQAHSEFSNVLDVLNGVN